MSGGGASYFPSRPVRLQRLVRQSVENTDEKRLESDINDYLQQFLTKLSERDAEKTRAYIDELGQILGEGHEIEKFLFGGSVAKHTYVDGLIDVDALVVLDRS